MGDNQGTSASVDSMGDFRNATMVPEQSVPLRTRIPKSASLVRWAFSPAGKVILGASLAVILISAVTLVYFYLKYSRLIDDKLKAGVYSSTSMVFAAPQELGTGEQITTDEVVNILRLCGYSESKATRMGSYVLRDDSLEIYPGPDSYFKQEAAVIKFKGGRIAQIVSLRDNTERTKYTLEPELITNLFDRNREKRRVVHFEDIPKVLVNAVVSVEDKRFFQHAGFDPLRIAKAAYVDIREGYRAQGASTLSMQTARMFWLDQEKRWSRKAAETLITVQLEWKLSKEKIFEYYANQVDLGRRGSFAIRGFGEAALVYFGKDLGQLSLQEAAALAGFVQRPNYTNPFRWPERAQARRNVVLSLMRDNGYINDREYAVAAASPIVVNKGSMESTDAPYFIDLVNDDLQDNFQDHDFQARTYRIYTTIDMNLQRAASEAIVAGTKELDERLKKLKVTQEAQVALIVLDAHTAEVKALVGGRNYGQSQLNRALAKRQPGSSFKPFVYAAALSTSLSGNGEPITAVTSILDEPTTFWFQGKPYEPNNHHKQYFGTVTVRQALARSMNIPAVKLAEKVGYGSVAQLARKAGLTVGATPSLALGSYDATPLDIAGAYTIFSNQGVFVKPSWVKSIRDDSGEVIHDSKPTPKPALDPRIAYLATNLMEEVVRSGTGAGIRSRGFALPAAGKTGTSHDGWFAGFTDKLICVVWVGFDDNKELPLDGALSALPIWAEFMKRAHRYREYSGAQPFSAPEGIVSVEIDPETGELATAGCPSTRSEVFVAGSQPQETCSVHKTAATHVASWDMPAEAPTAALPSLPPVPGHAPSTVSAAPPVGAPPQRASKKSADRVETAAKSEEVPETGQPRKRKGFFGRIREMIK